MTLLTCDWGRSVALPWDRNPCQEQAVRDMVLHDPHNVLGRGDRRLRLCRGHFEVVVRETDPARGGGGMTYLTEPVLLLAVKGQPAPQGSKRAFVNRHSGKPSMVESSKKVKPWREAVRSTAVDEWGERAPLDEPLRVSMVFTFARPKSHYRTGRNAHLLRDNAPKWPASPPDASKLARSTEDALTDAAVWRDDARIVSLTSRKVWAGEDPDALTVPGAVIRVWTEG